ncbi:MAG: GNAT family N-acetyltransferase [Gammaproteobacteria bacterium]|nr:GNAT family N-acetyltransferase [Gammaproteobacteria bacterium]MDP6731277.1 GNAT family N-acetyltransferase [Gammaproteobacteria bacterium]
MTLCYFDEEAIVGVIAIKELHKLDQLFVIPAKRRQGVALELWNAARSLCIERGNTGAFRVKSSSQAIPVYESFGFRVTGDRETRDGVSFTPMDLIP